MTRIPITESEVAKTWRSDPSKTDVATRIADLELRVQELERKTVPKEIARTVAREMLAARSRE